MRHAFVSDHYFFAMQNIIGRQNAVDSIRNSDWPQPLFLVGYTGFVSAKADLLPPMVTNANMRIQPAICGLISHGETLEEMNPTA
jgi:hypothetical protein